MSDNEVVAKRGRAAPDSGKVSAQKRPHETAKTPQKPENGSSPAKRGRGRPKGSKKANAKPKKPPVPGRGRGRPKANNAKPKNDSTEDESADPESGSD